MSDFRHRRRDQPFESRRDRRARPSPPPGITIAPAPPSVSVPAHRTVSLNLSVSVAAASRRPPTYVPLDPSFIDRGKRYSLAAAELTVNIPYTSLAAAYDTVAISDDSDVAAADFDGDGNSYSEQALTSCGAASGRDRDRRRDHAAVARRAGGHP